MCNDETTLQPENIDPAQLTIMLQKLHELEKDKLVQLNQHKIVVTQQGKLFVRIIAAAIDA